MRPTFTTNKYPFPILVLKQSILTSNWDLSKNSSIKSHEVSYRCIRKSVFTNFKQDPGTHLGIYVYDIQISDLLLSGGKLLLA